VRILVIEDEAGVREFIREGLTLALGAEVDAVADRSAIDLVRRNRYDVIVADMHLAEDLDALEIIETIAEFDHDSRFVLMTGKRRLDVATKLVTALKRRQVCSFLFKPFDLEELRIAVLRAAEPLPVWADRNG
jgi:DNA-binding NtrC family response regulator